MTNSFFVGRKAYKLCSLKVSSGNGGGNPT